MPSYNLFPFHDEGLILIWWRNFLKFKDKCKRSLKLQLTLKLIMKLIKHSIVERGYVIKSYGDAIYIRKKSARSLLETRKINWARVSNWLRARLNLTRFSESFYVSQVRMSFMWVRLLIDEEIEFPVYNFHNYSIIWLMQAAIKSDFTFLWHFYC